VHRCSTILRPQVLNRNSPGTTKATNNKGQIGSAIRSSSNHKPQTTGYLNNAYSQQTGFQNQPTGYQNGYSNGFPIQQTGLDQSQLQHQQPSFLQQQNTLQPQPTAFTNMNNPYAQQPNDFGSQFQSQQIGSPQAGTHNPWAPNQQQQSQTEVLKPTPTGSNNPFASSFNRPQFQGMQVILHRSARLLSRKQQLSSTPNLPSIHHEFYPQTQATPQKEQTRSTHVSMRCWRQEKEWIPLVTQATYGFLPSIRHLVPLSIVLVRA
jgi:epsin